MSSSSTTTTTSASSSTDFQKLMDLEIKDAQSLLSTRDQIFDDSIPRHSKGDETDEDEDDFFDAVDDAF